MTTVLDRGDGAGSGAASLDAPEVERFAGELFTAALGAVELVNVALGLQLGLYEALGDGPSTPAEVGRRAGIGSRHAREWLEQQAAAGVLDVEDVAVADDERRYVLPPSRAHVLLERDSEAYMGAMAESAVAAATWLPLVGPAYRSGTGVPYAAYRVHDLQAAFNRPEFAHQLVQTWLPALPDVHARLVGGGVRVAEVGCGEGLAAIALARGFPGVTVDGYDLDDASIAAARRHADEAGLGDRVRFEVADAATLPVRSGYDFVFCVEVLHDLSDPVAVLAAVRSARAEGGVVLVVDERVSETFQLPVDPMERLLYAFSTLHCLPAGLAEPPSAGTGAVLRPAVARAYARAAGFASVQELPLEHARFRFYRLEG